MTLTNDRPWWRRLNRTTAVLTILALLTLVVAGPGHRFGVLGFELAVLLSLGAALLAALGLITAIATLIAGRVGKPSRTGVAAILGLIVCAGLLVQFGTWASRASSVPQIHDISTDTDDPPAFVAIAPLRANAANPLEYPGAEVAALQATAYPDIRPAAIAAAPADILDAVAAVAAENGWEVVANDVDAGRFEATATTFWFGYKDDIVVRVRETTDGSDVDVRSKSRVGRSDLGTNAERIRALLGAVRERL